METQDRTKTIMGGAAGHTTGGGGGGAHLIVLCLLLGNCQQLAMSMGVANGHSTSLHCCLWLLIELKTILALERTIKK